MTAPTPSELKLVRGTARADRMNKAEPKPPSLEVGTKPPAWLKGARRRRAWQELAALLRDQRLLTVLDAAALALLVDAYGDYVEASDLIQGLACAHCGEPVRSTHPCSAVAEVEGDPAEDGTPTGRLVHLPHEPGRRYYTTRTESGSLMIRPHPAIAIRQDAWKRTTTLLSRFGMDPSSRTKVTAVGGDDRDPMADLLDDVG